MDLPFIIKMGFYFQNSFDLKKKRCPLLKRAPMLVVQRCGKVTVGGTNVRGLGHAATECVWILGRDEPHS